MGRTAGPMTIASRLARAVSSATLHAGLVSAAVVAAGRARGVAPTTGALLAVATASLAVGADVLAQRGDDTTLGDAVDRRLAAATALSIAAATIAGPLEGTLLERGASVGRLAIALAVAVAGIALRARAIHVLGDDFVTGSRSPRELRENDVYGWVRHPSESGLVLLSAGVATMTGSLVSFVATFALAILAVVRAEREDGTLALAFGVRFDRYAARVGALVPALGRPSPSESPRTSASRADRVE